VWTISPNLECKLLEKRRSNCTIYSQNGFNQCAWAAIDFRNNEFFLFRQRYRGRDFSPICTKFCTLIAEVIFKAEFVFDSKRKYFARLRGSQIFGFCAIYILYFAVAAPGEGRSCVLPGGPRRTARCEPQQNWRAVESYWTDTVFDRTRLILLTTSDHLAVNFVYSLGYLHGYTNTSLPLALSGHSLALLECSVVIVRPLSTVGYTSVAASVIHSRQWSN